MTDGLKAETLRQIYTTLEKCAAVGSQARLRVLFVDARIAQWRGSVPEADNLSERVRLLVGRLVERQNAQNQSALALFLWVVSDDGATDDAERQRLRHTAQAVTDELGLPPLNLPPIPSVAPTLSPPPFSPTAHIPPIYLDFALEIGAGTGRLYPVAARSTAGEAREMMRFPYDELQLESRLDKLQIALLQAGGPRRTLTPEEKTVQEFGQKLFDALFAGELLVAYRASRATARRQGKGLRLQLRIADAELAALPWEFLYDPKAASYLCLSIQTPIIRYLELPQPARPLEVTPPLRILGMMASPRGLPPLDTAREKERLMQATKSLREKGQVEVVWVRGQTWRDLQWEMRRGPWHVFHFIGHGGFDENREEGILVLADERGEEQQLYAGDLALLLADHAPLRLVVLNACEGGRGSRRDLFSSTAAVLTQRGIPAVLSMQYPIADWAAVELSRSFYEALVDNQPVDAAVGEARKGIRLSQRGNLEWGIPVLHMRSPNGQLFQIASPPLQLKERIQPLSTSGPGERREMQQKAPPLERREETTAVQELEKPAPKVGGFILADDLKEAAAAPEPGTAQPATQPIPPQAPQKDRQIPASTLSQKINHGWQAAARWWRALPAVVWWMPAGMAGIALSIWLALALVNGDPPVSTTTPQAIQKVGAAAASTETPTATPTPSLTPAPTLGSGSMITSTVDGMVQVHVPAGPFTMGSDDGESDAQPEHTVTLNAYWIDRTEVTNNQFAQFVSATGYETTAEREGGGYTDAPGEWNYTDGANWQHPQGPGSNLESLGNHPVVQVSWYDAAAYCKWAGRRLPTEAEWEKAARGIDARVYPWGDQFSGSYLNSCDSNCPFDWKDSSVNDGYSFTAPVGSFPDGASPYEVLDMVGNVWEWTADWYDSNYYESSPNQSPTGPTSGQSKVRRGSAWGSVIRFARTAVRLSNTPTVRDSNIGFRCAQESFSDMPLEPTATQTPSLTPTSTLGVGSMITSTVDGMVQVYVPAGPFTMGSNDGKSDEQPLHTVTLDAYWIDQTEVTNNQFAQFVSATSYETTAEQEGGGYTYTSSGWNYTEGADWQHPQGPGSSLDGLDDHPVVQVSWHDATAYCEWVGRRLPTEAEWEKAARGIDARVYPWGDQFDGNRLNSCDSNCPFDWKDSSVNDGYEFTAPVGSFPDGASLYGALDMAGNVWEWTYSLNRSYPYDADDGREDANGTGVRVLRGGSWDFYDFLVRVSNRDISVPTSRNDNVGIRCVQE